MWLGGKSLQSLQNEAETYTGQCKISHRGKTRGLKEKELLWVVRKQKTYTEK